MDDIRIDNIDDICVINVNLSSEGYNEKLALWNEFENNSIFQKGKIIIDLSTCALLDTVFIGVIVKIFRKVSENGGQMKLVFPQVTSIESFRVVGITKLLDCYRTQEETVESFNSQLSINKITLDENILSN